MKKLGIITVLTLWLPLISASGQTILAPKAGVTFSKMTGWDDYRPKDFYSKPGILIGLMAKRKFANRFNLQMDFSFLEKGTTKGLLQVPDSYVEKVNLYYLDAQLAVSFRISKWLSAEAGYFLAYNMKTRYKINSWGKSTWHDDDLNFRYKVFDQGLVFGLSSYYKQFQFSLRFLPSLKNRDGDYTNQAFAFSLGYLFEI